MGIAASEDPNKLGYATGPVFDPACVPIAGAVLEGALCAKTAVPLKSAKQLIAPPAASTVTSFVTVVFRYLPFIVESIVASFLGGPILGPADFI